MTRTLIGEPPAWLKQAAKEYGESLFLAAERRRMEARIRLNSMLLHTLNPRTCLSCGAKTDHNGEIPCGH
ncbi:MAG TPA: hypothetical protein VGD46_15695 [Rhizobacter sp.]